MNSRSSSMVTVPRVMSALVGLILTSVVSAAGAQTTYPVKPIRLVSGFAPGGTSDYLARVIGRLLAEAWGQSVVVENRVGAGGMIGAEVVARATPDGYTLFMGSVTTHAINPALYTALPFSLQNDFTPVAGVAAVQTLMVTRPSGPLRSVKDLIALAKSRPQPLNYGSAGVGSIAHMGTALLSYTTGLKMTHVPYKGEGQAAIDVISGQLDFMLGNMPSVIGLVRSGKLQALAVGGKARSPQLPDVPTIAEAGVPGYEMTGWYVLFTTAKAPRDVLVKLNDEIARGLQRNDTRELLASQGADSMSGSVDEIEALVRTELAKWAKVVAGLGLKVN
ncbi:MAG: tripartite tricarboxylate transporter substrate binding protein [Pseudomonadota bacterium]